MKIPVDPYPFYHHQPVQMRFNDLDALAHVNNTIYLEYMDFAKVQYITHVLEGCFSINHESLVIVNINVEFYDITRYGEPVEVLTRVDEIGEHTITFVQRVINPQTDRVKVIARTVMVGFSIDQDAKMVIPNTWRQRISKFERRQFKENA